MGLTGRAVELGEIAALLDAAAVGSGGVLTFAGPRGSGKTALLAVAADIARDRGFEVAAAAPVRGQSGLLLWAQLLQDIGASEEASRALLDATDSLAVSVALRPLTGLAAGARRLIVIDDIDADGDDAVEALRLVASRLVAGSTVVLVTASAPLGIGRDRVLAGLAEADMAALLRGLPPERLRAVWAASGGRPGTARVLASQLDSLPPGEDPLVHLALHAVSHGEFLTVDDRLIRLLEQAAQHTDDDATRARLLARTSRELLGDPLAGPRRRFLADEALAAARDAGDDAALAEVLDARLYALWDPAGAADRLATAGDLVKLGQSAGTGRWERDGLFWRFIALMELGQVDEAEITLAAFERAASAAGDAEDAVMALSRHAMLAVLRGRFDAGIELTEEFTARARRIGLPDAQRLTASLRGAVLSERGTEREQNAAVDQLYQVSRRFPGHFYEATAARILASVGRRAEATAELERLLPGALAASGPRWLGVITELATVAAVAPSPAPATRLYAALEPYAGRLVVWGGANYVNGPASYFLGLLAARLGMADSAVAHCADALDMAERIGALPAVARSLVALSEALVMRGADGDAREAAEASRRARVIAGPLGMVPLLRQLGTAADEWSLLRDGDGWLLEAGPERARLPDSRGLAHLRMLLAAPGRDITALDLAAGGPGLRASAGSPVLDEAAARSYKRRLAELDSELDVADAAGDAARARQAAAERAWLLGELRSAAGLGGRTRRTTAEAERARVNVTRTVRGAIDRVRAAAPIAGAHLQASIRTGLECRYEPAPGGPARWRV